MARKGAIPAQPVLEEPAQQPTTKLGKVLSKTRASIKSIFDKSKTTTTTPKAVLVKKTRVAKDITTRPGSPRPRSRSPVSRNTTRHPHTQAQLEAEGVQTRDFAADAVVTDRNGGLPAASLLQCILDRDTIRLGRHRDTDVEPVVDAQEESVDANSGEFESRTNEILTRDIIADADTQSLISIAQVEAIAVALEAADSSSTASCAWNNLDLAELSSANSSHDDNDDGSEAVGDSSNTSGEDRDSASEGLESHLDWDFDPAREFSNRFDGPSDAEDYDTTSEVPVPGIRISNNDSPKGTYRRRRRDHCSQESNDSSFTIIEDYFSDPSNADSANGLAALKTQLEERDGTISALRREISDINWSRDIELNNVRCDHAVELDEQHEAISNMWQHHCEENADILEKENASQNLEMATQEDRYGEHLRKATDSYGVALLKKDWAFQMIAKRYESALAEKDKEVAAAREEAEDAKSALTLKEANHKNEILDLKEDYEAVVTEMKTDLATTKAKLQKSEKSAKQLKKKNKALESEVKAQKDLANDSTLRLDIARTRVSQLEVDLAKTKAIAKIVIKNHHEEKKSLKLRNSILVSANQTVLAGQENLCYYIEDHKNAYFTYYEENKDLQIELRALRNKLPHVTKDRYQLLEEMARNMEMAHQRECNLMADLSMMTESNNRNSYEADYYYQGWYNTQLVTNNIQKAFDNAGKANEKMHELYDDLKTEFDEYKEETEDLEDELEDLKEKLEISKKPAEEEGEEHTEAMTELQNENQALRADAANLEETFARRIRLLTHVIRDPEHPDHRAVFEVFRNSDSIVEEVLYSTDGTMTPFLVRNVPVEQAIVNQLEQLEDRRLDAARQMYEQWLNTEPNNTPLHPPELGIKEKLEQQQQQQAASASLADLRDDASAAPANPMTDTTPTNVLLFDFGSQDLSQGFNLGDPAQPEGFRSGAQDQALPIPPVVPSNAPPLDYDSQTSPAGFNFSAGATPDIFAFGAQNQSLVVPSNNHDVAAETPASLGDITPFTFGSPATPPPFNFGPRTPATPAHPFVFSAQRESNHPGVPDSFDFGATTTTPPSNPAPVAFSAPTRQPMHTPTASSSPSAERRPGTYRDEASGRIWQLRSGRWVTEKEYHARLSYEPFVGDGDEAGEGAGEMFF